MTEEAFYHEFLCLISDSWKDADTLKDLVELKSKLPEAPNYSTLKSLLEARISVIEKKTDKGIAILEEIIEKTPLNPYALLLLSLISGYDKNEYEKSICFIDIILNNAKTNLSSNPLLVSRALCAKAFAFLNLNKYIETIDVYDEVIERFETSTDISVLKQVLIALTNKATTFEKIGKNEEAIALLDLVTKRFEKYSETQILVVVAKALLNKAVFVIKFNRQDEAIAIYDEIIKRFENSNETKIQEQVAKAFMNKAVVFTNLNQCDEAMAIYNEVIKRFENSSESRILEKVALALSCKIPYFGELNKHDEAIAISDEVIKRFENSSETQILEQVALAFLNQAVSFIKLNKFVEAIINYNEVIKRFENSSEIPIIKKVAMAMSNKAVLFGDFNKHNETIAISDEVIKRFENYSDLQIQEQVAIALLTKAVSLGKLGKYAEAITIFDKVIKSFENSSEIMALEKVAIALLNKAVIYKNLHKINEAIAIYDEVIKRFGDSSEIKIIQKVANSFVSKGYTLKSNDRKEEAIEVFKNLYSKYKISDDKEIKIRIAESLYYLSDLYFSTKDLLKADEYLRQFFSMVESNKIQSNIFPIFRNANDLKRKISEEAPSTLAIDQSKKYIEETKFNISENLRLYLDAVFKQINKQKQDEYFERMDKAKKQIDKFIEDDSHFCRDLSFLLILRQWNSYTPIIPVEEEPDKGGGYYIRHNNEGIVIDPGYDFLENFYRAGGRLCDIDHIIVTHAHDDHTAELEALLMLLNRHNQFLKSESRQQKRVSAYFSTGVQRKFSGIIDLRNRIFKKVLTLIWTGNGAEQRIMINKSTTLFTLPAYHDDVVTRDMSVGLGFIIETDGIKRKIVFTGDSGLYPRAHDQDGEQIYYDEKTKHEPKLDTQEEKALFNQYHESLKQNTDLLVVHIGSIKKQEFVIPEPTPIDSFKKQEFETPQLISQREEGQWYYPNHLGLLGTLTMLHNINPTIGIVSEFGAELKGFHIELVEKIGQTLNKKQTDEQADRETFVLPGDLTIIYNIKTGKLLNHSTCNFDESKLEFNSGLDYKPVYDPDAENYDVEKRDKSIERVYLWPQNKSFEKNEKAAKTKDFFHKFYNYKLPIHANNE